MKHKYITTLTATTIATLALLAPSTAFASPYTPDGSVPYGENTICQVTADYDPTVGDTADTTCSPIPTGSWENATAPDITNAEDWGWIQFGKIDWLSSYVNLGSTVSSEDPENLPSFVVRPTNPANSPFIADVELNVNTSPYHNDTDATPQWENVQAYFIADNSVVASAPNGDPFADASTGNRIDRVSTRTTQTIPLTVTGEGTYNADLFLPTPTYTWETDGTLNGYGWAGYILAVGETTNAQGEPVTQIQRQAFQFSSGYSPSITDFLYEEFQPDGTSIGVVGSGYDLMGDIWLMDAPPVVEPPVVEPPVVTPPVVTPPVVEPPVVVPPVVEPPVGLKVNTGAIDSAPVWVAGLIALLTFSTGGYLFFRNRNTQNVE